MDQTPTAPRYSDYFADFDVRNELALEFVSLWPSWLGQEYCHKLDAVTDSDWEKFNRFVEAIADSYPLWIPNHGKQKLEPVRNVQATLSNHSDAQQKSADRFSQYVIESLECIVSEHWDYTFIIWHWRNGAVESLAPLIERSGLFHFHDDRK